MDALLGALGALFASGAGILILILAAALAVILWSWQIAIAAVVFLQLGVGALLVHIHKVPGILIGGQLLAAALAAAMLAIAGSAASHSPSLRRGGNWPLRLSALIFVAGAWWFIDPGMTIPQFSQPETDLLLWIGICGLVILCMTGNPTFTGIAMMLWCVPLYTVSAVLLPGSGLPVLVGIAELLLALACAYLTLVEPSAVGAGVLRRSRWPLPPPERAAGQGGQPPAPPIPNPLIAGGRRSAPAASAEAPALVEKSA